MKARNNDYIFVRDLAYAWDKGMVEHIDFTGRIAQKYGPEYVKQKLAFISGRYEDAVIPGRFDYLATQRVIRNNDNLHDDLKVFTMQVPENEMESWAKSIPGKDLKEYIKKKEFLDKYLANFSAVDRNRLINIMTTDSNSYNYATFMDLDPNLMTTQQYLIYQDIINFYDYVAYHDMKENMKLWSYFEDTNDAIEKQKMKQVESSSKLVQNQIEEIANTENSLLSIENIDNENQEINDLMTTNEELKTILENKQKQLAAEPIEIIEKSIISNEYRNHDDLNQKLVRFNNLANEIRNYSFEQQNTNHVRTLDLAEPKIKTLMFTPTTTVLKSPSIFGQNHSYAPDYTIPLAMRNINIVNPYISNVNNATNIADLIAQRDEVMNKNKLLVNDIISNQITYNNQFIPNASNQAYNQYASPNSVTNRNINQSLSNLQSNNYSGTNINTTTNVANSNPFAVKYPGQAANDSSEYVKPKLIKLSANNKISNQNQSMTVIKPQLMPQTKQVNNANAKTEQTIPVVNKVKINIPFRSLNKNTNNEQKNVATEPMKKFEPNTNIKTNVLKPNKNPVANNETKVEVKNKKSQSKVISIPSKKLV